MKQILVGFTVIFTSLVTFAQERTAQVAFAPIAPVNTRAEIESGLKSHDHALFIKDHWIRDPYIILGPDDYYYLTGTTPNPNDPREKTEPYNKGLFKGSIVGATVQLWRSKDLIDWEYLETPYTVEDTYQYRDEFKEKLAKRGNKDVIWAPEIHWIKDHWALVHCPGAVSSLAFTKGLQVSGPWTHPMGKAFDLKHDPSLFQDDDGSWYALWANTYTAKIKDDFSGFDTKPFFIEPASERPDPEKPGKLISRIGHEGATMRKIGGKYVSFGTAWSTDLGRKGSYNLYYCVADEITGEYGPRKFAGRFLGHGTPFQTRDGKWWCTAFFNGDIPPVSQDGIETRDLSETAQTINQRGTTIVPLEVKVLDNGEIYIRAKDPAYANPGPDENQKF
ncbi:family 43 glycosylhydrolase [Sunxiuqinia sp. A32]|uniref:family 43 glycosylhydrolase n=1 Tax=Sunxiuqinia sp. A32 TaxID=3461496 RepID=UPI00404629A0